MQNDEILKLNDLYILNNNNDINNNINQYAIKINYLQSLLYFEYECKPSKLMINEYRNWKKRVKKINDKLIDVYNIIENEINEIYENITLMKNQE